MPAGGNPTGATTSHTGAAVAAARGRVVARVAGEAVTDVELQAAAREAGTADARAALEHVVRARLLAREAARRGLREDYPAVADVARRAAVQALLLADVEARVRPDTVPADVMAQGMALRAFDLSHGELWRTQHAVARVPERADPATRARARGAAEQLRARAAAMPAPRTAAAFEALANEVLAGVEHRVEMVPPCEASGRMQRGALDPSYARAAAALAQPGDLAPVTETPFGYHVILLHERLPALVRAEEEVRATVRTEAVWRLRHRALQDYLGELRTRYNARVRDEALRAVERVRLEEPSAPERPGASGP